MNRTIRGSQLRQQRADTPADIAWRVKHNRVLEQVRHEVTEMFPNITAENITAALAYQERRIAELMG